MKILAVIVACIFCVITGTMYSNEIKAIFVPNYVAATNCFKHVKNTQKFAKEAASREKHMAKDNSQ